MFCKNCGGQINDGAAFCPFCGSAQNNQPAQQQNYAPQNNYQVQNGYSPVAPYQGPQPLVSSPPVKRKHRALKAIIALVLVLLIAGAGVFGFFAVRISNRYYVSSMRYYYVDDNNKVLSDSTVKYLYDGQIASVKYNGDSTDTKYEYDSKNRVTEIKQKGTGYNVKFEAYSKKDGYEVSEGKTKDDEGKDAVVIVKYKHGMIVEQSAEYEDDSYGTYIDYYYDGRIKSRRSESAKSTSVTEYDNEGNVVYIKTVSSYSEKSVTHEATITYDEGRIVKETSEESDNNLGYTIERTESDDKYDTMKCSKNDGTEYEMRYYYDSDNNLLKKVALNDDGEETDPQYTYEYDDNGNMTKEIQNMGVRKYITENKYEKVGFKNAVKILLGYLR